jgi:hypothetical protein
MSGLPRVPKALRDWRVTVPIGAVLGVMLAASTVGIPGSDHSSQAAQPTPVAAPQSPVPAPVNPDKDGLDKLRKTPGTGYNCPENDSAEKYDQLRLCPDYTATITFTPNSPTQHPIVTMPQTYDGLTPIIASVEPIHSCGNDGVEGVPITCEDLWRVRWTIGEQFVPLGYNQQSTKTIRDDGSSWTGPIGMDWPKGDQLVSPKDTRSIEIYAGEPTPKTVPSPLSPDRDAPHFDAPPTTTTDPDVLTV